MSEPALIAEPCLPVPSADLEALLAAGTRPYPMALIVAGAVLVVLALAAMEDLSKFLVLLLAVLGIAGLALGLRWSSHESARQRERTRQALDALPVELLVRAAWSPELSEKSRIAIANYLNTYHPGRPLLPGADDEDFRQLGRGRSSCGPRSCGGGGCC